MSVQVNLSAKKALNLLSLKRKFPTVESILAEAAYISLFRYMKSSDSSTSTTKYWSKESVTGPLFIVKHTTGAMSMVILNQEGKER